MRQNYSIFHSGLNPNIRSTRMFFTKILSVQEIIFNNITDITFIKNTIYIF